MIDESTEPKFVRQVRAAQLFDPSKFFPLEIGGARAGWIRKDRTGLLRRWTDVFELGTERVRLSAALAGEPARTAALAEVVRTLERDGAIRGWRNETYAVRIRPQDEPLLHIERAAMRFFGLTSVATHLNGKMGSVPIFLIWIARRSATKSIDPGLLDTLVGGGVPSGQDPWHALLRECHEEAGIERALATQARAAGTLQVCHEVPEGLHSEILYAHDLEVPADFRPRNVDGEVAEFLCVSPAEVAERIAGGELTVEAGLLTLDFLLRHQAIESPDPQVRAALEGCRVRP
jgi:8-oxo-dGTP pyrophosphatase MutT (NUDIX family)